MSIHVKSSIYISYIIQFLHITGEYSNNQNKITFIPCHLDIALSGRNALRVRKARKAEKFPAPWASAIILARDTCEQSTSFMLFEKTICVYLMLDMNKTVINPCKPGILFMGHKQIVQIRIRCHKMWHLISVSIFCLQNELLKFE